jgi:hypothetical protein
MWKPWITMFLVAIPAITSPTAMALADDFTFSVPVSVDRLPREIRTVHVCCEVTTRRGGRSLGNRCIGREITGSRFSGTITVPVNAMPGEDPALARHYYCRLRLAGVVRESRVWFETDLRFPGARIPTVVNEGFVEGSLPAR